YQVAHGDPAGWRREATGRPLLLAAPLVGLVTSGGGSLLPPGAFAAVSAPALAALLLAALAYMSGLAICYAAPGAAPWARPAGDRSRAASWMVWWGWLGLGAALPGQSPALQALPVWAGPLLLLLVAALAAGALSTDLVRALAT